MNKRQPVPPIEDAATSDAAAAKVRRVELLISNVLRTGVTISLALILLGTLVTFVRHPDYSQTTAALDRLTHPREPQPSTPGQVLGRIAQLRGQGIVTLGLLVLLLTPIARVAISVPAFVFQGDRVFVAITSTVLAVLLISLFLGHALG